VFDFRLAATGVIPGEDSTSGFIFATAFDLFFRLSTSVVNGSEACAARCLAEELCAGYVLIVREELRCYTLSDLGSELLPTTLFSFSFEKFEVVETTTAAPTTEANIDCQVTGFGPDELLVRRERWVQVPPSGNGLACPPLVEEESFEAPTCGKQGPCLVAWALPLPPSLASLD
jgi:hypothetical protein